LIQGITIIQFSNYDQHNVSIQR